MQSPIASYTHSLNCLAAILGKAETHCTEHKIDPGVLLSARLFPDMLPLTRNVQVTCDLAKGLAARLSQSDNAVFEDNEVSFDDLQERIRKTIAFMESVPEAGFEGAENREIVLKFGPREFRFMGLSYLQTFAAPNFYFHMTTSYNILRHNGVVLGKSDFLGAI